MGEVVTRIDRIRRGFNRLGWLWLIVLVLFGLLLIALGAYQGVMTNEPWQLALFAVGIGIGGMLIIRALGWVIAGFFSET